ncbi:MAG: hypothetical protein H8E14_06290 [Candidatus Marinimicrobia bacterium]|nr:hypothetical protein [Candidatus Neomarinimicrobiota bacterium]
MKACILSVEVQGEASSEVGRESWHQETGTDIIFDNIPLYSLQRIPYELHPSLKLKLYELPRFAFPSSL